MNSPQDYLLKLEIHGWMWSLRCLSNGFAV